ncbi:unnamed protein product [Candidula unifasciata]|uniref:RanBP2-type domain-containing protein n=1 Tax=Candidula unifasciata TaxID=100452 RepID=A0A8S3ZX38_9EUPU|nr:unnamed protein product [Candidula unifasciata]
MESLSVLGDKLAAAIHAGDSKEAALLVSQLSNMKLKLDINIKQEAQEQRNSEQEFSVRVHVEDRISDGCYFYLLVKSSDTIQDLKRKVMLKYNFPEEVQRWIIGKKIPDNENKLSQCGVKGPGHTLYLYLVTARSVGLSRQDYESRHQALEQAGMVSSKQFIQTGSSSPAQRESPEPYWPAPLSPRETQTQNYSNNHSPVLASSPVFGIGEVDSGQNSYGPARQTSKRSLSSGSSLIQEMLMAPNLSSLAASESQPKLATQDSGIGHWPADFEGGMPRLPTATKPRAPSSTPPSKNEKIGWECPMCTFINLPMRPGCEMCSGPRPSNYKIPSDYNMTPEEVLLLENDKRLEMMTREATPSDRLAMFSQQPDFFAQHRDQQINGIMNNNNIVTENHWDSSVNNQLIDDEYIYVPNGSDWTNAQEVALSASPSFEVETRPQQHNSRWGQNSRRSLPVAAPPPYPQQLQPNVQAAKRNSIASHLINFLSQNATQHESSVDN